MLPIAKPWIFAGNAEWVPYTKTLILGNTWMLYEESKTLAVSYWVGYNWQENCWRVFTLLIISEVKVNLQESKDCEEITYPKFLIIQHKENKKLFNKLYSNIKQKVKKKISFIYEFAKVLHGVTENSGSEKRCRELGENQQALPRIIWNQAA